MLMISSESSFQRSIQRSKILYQNRAPAPLYKSRDYLLSVPLVLTRQITASAMLASVVTSISGKVSFLPEANRLSSRNVTPDKVTTICIHQEGSREGEGNALIAPSES